jgi:hypothetical protein
MKYRTTSAKTATFNASDNCPLTSSTTQQTSVRLKARIGVAVDSFTTPNQVGANLSLTNINVTLDGTNIVPFRAVMIAAIAPTVTNMAAPPGRYNEATSAIGALLD